MIVSIMAAVSTNSGIRIEPHHRAMGALDEIKHFISKKNHCNILAAYDLMGIASTLYASVLYFSGGKGSLNATFEGRVSNNFKLMNEQFVGIIQLVGKTIGISDDKVKEIISSVANGQFDDLDRSREDLTLKFKEIDQLTPENHIIRVRGKGQKKKSFDYSQLFIECVTAFNEFTQARLMLPEETTSAFRVPLKREGEPQERSAAEYYVCDLGMNLLPVLRKAFALIHLQEAQEFKLIDDVVRSQPLYKQIKQD